MLVIYNIFVSRAKNRRPDVQVYVPRGRRLQMQQQSEQPEHHSVRPGRSRTSAPPSKSQYPLTHPVLDDVNTADIRKHTDLEAIPHTENVSNNNLDSRKHQSQNQGRSSFQDIYTHSTVNSTEETLRVPNLENTDARNDFSAIDKCMLDDPEKYEDVCDNENMHECSEQKEISNMTNEVSSYNDHEVDEMECEVPKSDQTERKHLQNTQYDKPDEQVIDSINSESVSGSELISLDLQPKQITNSEDIRTFENESNSNIAHNQDTYSEAEQLEETVIKMKENVIGSATFDGAETDDTPEKTCTSYSCDSQNIDCIDTVDTVDNSYDESENHQDRNTENTTQCDSANVGDEEDQSVLKDEPRKVGLNNDLTSDEVNSCEINSSGQSELEIIVNEKNVDSEISKIVEKVDSEITKCVEEDSTVTVTCNQLNGVEVLESGLAGTSELAETTGPMEVHPPDVKENTKTKTKKEKTKSSKKTKTQKKEKVKVIEKPETAETATVRPVAEAELDDLGGEEEEDTWDAMFDDDGECLDPDAIKEV